MNKIYNMIKLSNYVGKTPLIPLSIKYTGKAELMNPGGSVKDRMASFILNVMMQKKKYYQERRYFVRQTSGNTGNFFQC